MKLSKILLGIGFAASLMLTGQAQAFVIDDFNTDPPTQTVTDTTADATPVWANTTITPGNVVMNSPGGAPGWTRTIHADLIAGDSVSAQVCAVCQAGHLVSGAAGAVGNVSFEYTGPSIDFLGYTKYVQFLYAADHDGAVVTITFSDGVNPDVVVSSGALANTGGSSSPANYQLVHLALPSFAGGPGFNDITSVTLDIAGVPDLDFTIDNLQTIPEPGTLALLGLGLAGLGFQARRRRKSA